MASPLSVFSRSMKARPWKELAPYVSKVRCSLNILDWKAAGVKEFSKRIRSPKVLAAIPTCEVYVDVHEKQEPPAVNVEFVDGTVLDLEAERRTYEQLMIPIDEQAELISFQDDENDVTRHGTTDQDGD